MNLRTFIILLPAAVAGCVTTSSISNVAENSGFQPAIVSQPSEGNIKELEKCFSFTNQITFEIGYVPDGVRTNEPPIFVYYSRECEYMLHASRTNLNPEFYFQCPPVVYSPTIRPSTSYVPTGHRDLSLIDTTPLPPVNVDIVP